MLPVLAFLLLFPAALAVDLEVTIDAPDVFNLSQSNTYKLITKNLNGTSPEDVNFTLEYWINNSAGYVMGFPKNTSDRLKLQKTISRTWTPTSAGNYTICSNITSSTANDTNNANDYACKDIFVNGSSGTNASGDCDLQLDIVTNKVIYNESESIDYDLITSDLICSGINHPYSVEYEIADLFGNYLRSPFTSEALITCADTLSRTKKAGELCGSEAYLIKAAIKQANCNDTNADNNEAEFLIIVKGKDPDSSACEASSNNSSDDDPSLNAQSSKDFTVEILDYQESAKQGDNVETKIKITNNLNQSATIDVYSYVFQGSSLASLGGWTANKESFDISADGGKEIILENAIKSDAVPGIYSLRARVAYGDKKYDATKAIEILLNPDAIASDNAIADDIGEIELSARDNSARDVATGSFIPPQEIRWQSGSSLALAAIIFSAALAILALGLLATLRSNKYV